MIQDHTSWKLKVNTEIVINKGNIVITHVAFYMLTDNPEIERMISLEKNSADSGLQWPINLLTYSYDFHSFWHYREKIMRAMGRKYMWVRGSSLHSHYKGRKTDSQVRFSWNVTNPQLYHSGSTFWHNNKPLRKIHFYLGQNDRLPSVRELGGNYSLEHQEDCNLYRDFHQVLTLPNSFHPIHCNYSTGLQ